jgi:DNA-binding NtrC family response regulator
MLFGHAKGVFTGATDDRPGKLEEANNGTLFLDELGYASRAHQQLLLIAMDRKEAIRLGEVRPRRITPRFVFATTQEPRRLKEAGQLSDELYFRLGPFTIRLPALRERAEAILPLARQFLITALKNQRKAYCARLNLEVEAVLQAYDWPGNIRELEFACQCMAASLEEDRPVRISDLPDEVRETNQARVDEPSGSPRDQALNALKATGGNKSAAARRLEMSRQQLYRLIEREKNEVPDRRNTCPA